MDMASKPAGRARFGLGAPVRRLEDDALVRGHGRYTADVSLDGELCAYFLRSDHAHARFRIEGVDDARAAAGVHLVWTGDDEDGWGELPVCAAAVPRKGTETRQSRYPLICANRVRAVGDVIAMIVADTREAALDAAMLLQVDYEELAVVVGVEDALAPDAPWVWPEFRSNVAFESELGDAAAVDAAFASARHVAKLKLVHNRLVSNYMEPRAVIAEFDGASGIWTIILPSQGVLEMRKNVAVAMNVPPDRLHVKTYDVGGGFGPKFFAYRDYPLVALAAAEIGRPVKWVSDRMEHFVADAHGRDAVTEAELALDGEGRALGLRVRWTTNLGAYMSAFGSYVPYAGAGMVQGVYDIPAVHVLVRGVYTNTTPTDAYRGAGRPEAAFTIERLMDEAAAVCALSPVEIRRRNFIRPEQMPYRTATSHHYDSGEFSAQLDMALAAADHAGFEARLEASRSRGLLRGIGLSTYIEACAAASSETAHLVLEPDGTVTLCIGTQSNGQGHRTVYAQIACEVLGLEPSQIAVRQGDSEHPVGAVGTRGSRSIPIGVPAVRDGAGRLAAAIRSRAAEHFNVPAEDLVLEDGMVLMPGTNHAMSLAELARGAETDLSATGVALTDKSSYPNGTYVCEVEIDPDTGVVSTAALTAVDDFGVTVNPTLLDGQIHGGIAQGLGQALLEGACYDAAGQLLTAGFTEYAMPRATDIPHLSLATRNVPAKWNPMGLKGAGEAGATGSTPAVVNAVIDALRREYGISNLDMPLTPLKVWAAIQAATAG